jgi:DNA-directed RNA polymerase specialized sigma24 family protein
MSFDRRLVESLSLGFSLRPGWPIRSLDDPYSSQSSLSVTPSALRRYRAERLLRKDFPELRAKVLAVVSSRLRSKGIALDHADLESCYAQAFHGLYATVLDGEEIENPTGWLVTVTFRRAIDESSSVARRGSAAEAHPAAGRACSTDEGQWAAPDYDIARALDDRATIREVFEGLRSSLSPRECEAASLCYLQGFTRAEAAERMGIRAARMHKLMEGAAPGRPGVAGKVGELLSTIKAGGWCERQSSLMRAYAFGILDPDGERHALAAAHCRECPACRAHVASLRGLAAVLPPLPLPLAFMGGTGAIAGTGPDPGAVSTTAGAGSGAAGGASGGWLAGMGSLAAKLAVVGVAAIGAGIVLHGSGAHGRSGGALRAASGSSATRGEARSRVSLVTPLGRTLRGSATDKSSAPSSRRRRRTGVTRGGRPGSGVSASSVAAPEFSPERVRQPARTSAPPLSTPGAGEFGF